MKELLEQDKELLSAPLSKWRAYPAYKDSGIEWLGEIPEHWQVKRLKLLCKINPPKSELRLASSTKVSFLPMEKIGGDGTISIEETRKIEQVWQGYTYFRDGDIVVAKITPCFENGKGALCINLRNGVGFGTTELHVLRPQNQIIAEMLFHIIKSSPFRMLGAASMYGAAGQQRVSEDFVSNFQIGIPSLYEQRAIATFLDRETIKTNALIEKKERLIALLQEKRIALISQAVTKGLNPDVSMKDSGVEWLGEIPTHWEMRRLKFAASFLGGGTPSKSNNEYWSGNIPWTSPKDMKAENIYDAEDHITEDALSNSTTQLIRSGAVLIVVRSGILKHSIPVAINAVPVALNQDMKAIIPHAFLLARYLALLIIGHQDVLLLEWRKSGATVESIEFELLINTSCPIPSITEQQTIVTYLDQETAKIDSLISVIRKGIKKLQEYSTALISAAVTGKIDVRGEQAGTIDDGEGRIEGEGTEGIADVYGT